MSTVKLLDVNKFVITPKKEIYCEPITDRKGRVKLEELDDEGKNIWRFQHQLEKKDTPIFEDKKIGDIICYILDQIDQKANGEEIRKRFSVSCSVENSMDKNQLLEIETKDLKVIENALENTKNPLFNYRIQEAIDTAEIKK